MRWLSPQAHRKMEKLMKKYLAIILVLCLSAALFVACGDTPAETTPAIETTEGTATTPEVTTVETTTEETAAVFTDPQIFDNVDYDYAVRTVLDEDDKIIGVAIFKWHQSKAAEEITVGADYVINGKTYPIIQVGVAQGILEFQSTLKVVNIPANVKKIGKLAFSQCSALTTLNLPEGLETIEKGAFWNCNSLASLTLPSTVTSIGQAAFGGCASLKTLVIPSGIESIATNAFSNCVGLETVTLPRRFENEIATIFPNCSDTLTFVYVD